MSHIVFVYGTLRKHERNHHIMRGAQRLAEQAYTFGELWDTGNGYPAVTRHDQSLVYGELYRVDDETLQRLDAFECFYGPNDRANHYERVEQTCYTDHGTYKAYLYIYVEQPAQGQRIALGDWKCEQIKKRDQILYFAYGSCMDDARFKSANVDHLFTKILGRGLLQNYALTFGYEASDGFGRADLVEQKGERVEGKIYEIDQEALTYLYDREGVSSQIYRPTFVNVAFGSETLTNVLTFTVINKLERDVPPPEVYMHEILRGAKGTVSEDYYERLVAKFQSLNMPIV